MGLEKDEIKAPIQAAIKEQLRKINSFGKKYVAKLTTFVSIKSS